MIRRQSKSQEIHNTVITMSFCLEKTRDLVLLNDMLPCGVEPIGEFTFPPSGCFTTWALHDT
jgi:hypothetical protein